MRWIYRILGLIVVLVVLAIAAFFLVPADRIAGLAESRFEAATGRTLNVEGDVRPRLWPSLGINTGAIEIANADWADDTPMLQAEGLSVSVDLGALIGGDIRITGVEIKGPQILLETNSDGAGNWEFASGEAPAATGGETSEPGTIPAFSIDQATISGGSLTYRDAAGAETRLTDIDATLTLPEFDGPISLVAATALNGQPVSVDAAIPRFSTFLTGSTDGVALGAVAGDASVSFEGSAGLAPLEVSGALSGTLGRFAGLAAVLGIAPPALPQGLGASENSFSGQLGFVGTNISYQAARIVLDQNTLTGDIAVALDGPRPKITAALNAGALDLSALGGGEEEAAAAAEGDTATGWSTEPIDASGLNVLDADITIAAESVALGTSTLGRTNLGITIDRGRMVTDIRELVAYDGAVNGAIVVNARDGLSVRADLAGSSLAISRLLAELLDYDQLISIGDMQLSVLGSGNSMNAIMNSLNGEGSFEFGAGELIGFDLVGMLRNLDTSFIGESSKTIFDSITGTFLIVDGVVINENLSLLSPLLTATGRGTVGLGGQTLDYRLTPKLLAGEGEGISVPLLISGTWAAPKFRLDLQSLVDDKVQAEIEAAKDRAEQELKEKAAKELGLADDGPSAKEAVQDKVEDELKKGLGKLFGR